MINSLRFNVLYDLVMLRRRGGIITDEMILLGTNCLSFFHSSFKDTEDHLLDRLSKGYATFVINKDAKWEGLDYVYFIEDILRLRRIFK